MAFQTGSLSTVQNIIDNLDTFAVANGYTKNQKYTNGNWYILSLTKNSLVYNIAVDTTNNLLELQIPTSHTASSAWGSDPGANTAEPQANNLTGLSGYDFFANSTNIRGVIKLNDGRYKPFCFGETVRTGYTGLPFCGATYWNETGTSAYTPFSGFHAWLMYTYSTSGHYAAIRVGGSLHYQGSSPATATGYVSSGWKGGGFNMDINNALLIRTPSDSNLRATGVQKFLAVSNGLTGSNLRYAPAGYIDGFVDLNITHLNPEQVVDTDWVVYPYIKKDIGQATSGNVSSQEYGLAFQK